MYLGWKLHLKAGPGHESYSKVNSVYTGSVFVIWNSCRYIYTQQTPLADTLCDIMHYSIELFISIVTYDKFYLDFLAQCNDIKLLQSTLVSFIAPYYARTS